MRHAQTVGIDGDAAAALYERLRTLAEESAHAAALEPRGRSERKAASRLESARQEAAERDYDAALGSLWRAWSSRAGKAYALQIREQATALRGQLGGEKSRRSCDTLIRMTVNATDASRPDKPAPLPSIVLAAVGGTLAVVLIAFLSIIDRRYPENDVPDWAGSTWVWMMVASATCLGLAAALAAALAVSSRTVVDVLARVVVGFFVFLGVFVSVVFVLFVIVYAAANRDDDDTPPVVTTPVPGSRP